MTALLLGVGIQFAVADQAEKGGYGGGPGKAEEKKVEGKFATGDQIDKTKKPMPSNNMVLAIVAHSAEGDPNPADGGFSLTKAGGGRTIHVSGNRVHHVDAPLAGYGTAETASFGRIWVYEVQGLTVGGYKVYAGISGEYTGNEMRPLWISLGKTDPVDGSSFGTAGWAVAGRKEP